MGIAPSCIIRAHCVHEAPPLDDPPLGQTEDVDELEAHLSSSGRHTHELTLVRPSDSVLDNSLVVLIDEVDRLGAAVGEQRIAASMPPRSRSIPGTGGGL